MSEAWFNGLQQQKAIAVIRSPHQELGLDMAKAVAAGGMQLIEITWNSTQPAQLVTKLRSQLPHCWIGAGTLLTQADLQAAVEAGAQFLFTPHTDPVLIQAAVSAGIPIVPGALTPTEIVTAWQAGASCVKVFPIQAVGGIQYLRALRGPLGQIPLIPTGGVTLGNAPELIAAGATAVGLSSDLFPPTLVKQQDWSAIAQLAKTLLYNLNPNRCP
ncbi:MAG: bifunctional 4-hydroxy-2-oxoglutarate aldolase/2-dehydro-3-deoxy-phosphogluconate aldolase [Desertifilum sp. SIO1I2]|nr:bifunctional 4-hydroxy-2-oxoglutarate aldolase/2-dehydro-3-deoxy-phosphogluconate aldolase [Desertifilum sp. SIO1I2]